MRSLKCIHVFVYVSDGIERNLCPLSLFTLLVFIVQLCHFLNMKHYLGKVNKWGASQVVQNLGNWLILIFKYWYCKTFFWLCLTTSIIFVSRPTKKKKCTSLFFYIVPKSKCNNQNTTFMVILHGLRPIFRR